MLSADECAPTCAVEMCYRACLLRRRSCVVPISLRGGDAFHAIDEPIDVFAHQPVNGPKNRLTFATSPRRQPLRFGLQCGWARAGAGGDEGGGAPADLLVEHDTLPHLRGRSGERHAGHDGGRLRGGGRRIAKLFCSLQPSSYESSLCAYRTSLDATSK